MQGPFTTGVQANGADSGTASGFSLSLIENDPSNFFADTHTAQFVAGAVRGQLLKSEVPVKRPKKFTSLIRTYATPEQVINANNASVPGLQGAKTKYNLHLNTEQDIMCYDIVSEGFQGEYFSPAKTATHTHQAAFGSNGPPRLAFPNPTPIKDWNLARKLAALIGLSKNKELRRSEGCVKGPFTTGLLSPAGADTGSASGFTLSQLEQNPQGFFSDYHTEAFPAGAVRGNMYRA